MVQKFHSAYSDADFDLFSGDEVILDRLNVLKQQLQHKINDKCQFGGIWSSLRHNLSPPCKVKNCQWPHARRCGASDHINIMSDKHHQNQPMDDEKN